MSFEILATKSFVQAYKRHQHPHVVRNKIQILAVNSSHPSLNVHPLHKVRDRSIWDCYISEGERLLYEIKSGVLRLWDLGSHSVVDKAHLRGFSENKQFVAMNNILQDPSLAVDDSLHEDKHQETRYQHWYDNFSIDTNQQEITGSLQKDYNPLSLFEDGHLRIFGVPHFLVKPLKEASSFERALNVSGLDEAVRVRFEEAYTTVKLYDAMFDESLLKYRLTIEDLEGL